MSNYYERKYDDMKAKLKSIDEIINALKGSYRLQGKGSSVSKDNFLQYRYREKEKQSYKDISKYICQLEDKKDVLKTERNKAYNIYQEYYRKAKRG